MKTVIIMVAVMLLSAVTAEANEGRPTKRVWNPANPVEELQAGNEVCEGSRQLHTCQVLNSLSGEIFMQQVSRPRGIGKNVVYNSVVMAESTGLFARDENGKLIARMQNVSEQGNAFSLWTQGLSQAPASAVNGALSAKIMANCGDNCGGGGGAIAIANSVAGAEAGAEASISGFAGGCPSGNCAVPPAQ